MVKYIYRKVMLMKKFTAFFILFVFIVTLCACNNKETSHKTGWQNPAEPVTTDETTSLSEEETTAIKNDIPANSDSTVRIDFSEEKALEVGSFESEIYGKLTVFYQDGYFLLIDEFKDRKFTVFAENYSASKTDNKAVGIFEDMNFDGYTDFGVCYYKDAINSYYFCFLWNKSERTFDYFLPLSNLANPEFREDNKSVVAHERLTTTRTLNKTFVYSAGTLTQVSAKEVTDEPDNKGAETVNTDLLVSSLGKNAVIKLKVNENTHSKWECFIENENVVILGSEYFDEASHTKEFVLSGVSPGATTVIFRYVSVQSEEYIEEVIINAITKEDMTVNIVVPE